MIPLFYTKNRPIHLFVSNFINKDSRTIYKIVHISVTNSIKESIENATPIWMLQLIMAESSVWNHKYDQSIYSI